jgi:predicted nucleic acid-binding protein
MKDCPDLYPSLPLMQRAFDLSSNLRVGLYDCLYVALAEQQHCSLVTADERLMSVLPGFAIVSLAML